MNGRPSRRRTKEGLAQASRANRGDRRQLAEKRDDVGRGDFFFRDGTRRRCGIRRSRGSGTTGTLAEQPAAEGFRRQGTARGGRELAHMAASRRGRTATAVSASVDRSRRDDPTATRFTAARARQQTDGHNPGLQRQQAEDQPAGSKRWAEMAHEADRVKNRLRQIGFITSTPFSRITASGQGCLPSCPTGFGGPMQG